MSFMRTGSTPAVGILRAAFGVGLYLVVSMVVDAVVASTGFESTHPGGSLVVTLLVTWSIALLLVTGRSPRDLASRFAIHRFAPRILLPLIPMCLGLSVLGATAILWLPEPWLRSIEPNHYTGDVLLVASAAFLIGPLAEELFFRGWMFRGVCVRYGPLRSAIFTSFVFALVHVNPGSMVNAFLGGMLYAWLVYRTGSVWPAVVAHGLGNASQEILLWIGVSTGLIDRNELPLTHVPLPMLGASIVAVVVGWWAIERRYRPVGQDRAANELEGNSERANRLSEAICESERSR